MKKIIADLTPQGGYFRHCGIGMCPAVFKTDAGYILIGTAVKADELGKHSGRVGEGEVAIEIPPGMLEQVIWE